MRKQKKKMSSYLLSFGRQTYECIIVNPLRKLYLVGPAVWNVGFWGGLGKTEICQIVSPVSHSFWDHNADQCAALVETKFNSFRISLEIVAYFILLYQVYRMLMQIRWSSALSMALLTLRKVFHKVFHKPKLCIEDAEEADTRQEKHQEKHTIQNIVTLPPWVRWRLTPSGNHLTLDSSLDTS